MDQDVYAHLHGLLSKRQQRFLLYRFFERIIIASIPCYIVFFQLVKFTDVLTSILGWVIGLFGIGSTVIFTWNYGYDLLFSQSRSTTGSLHKYRRRIGRGPAYYCVLVADKELFTTKPVWLQIEEGKMYEVFYAERTKWLLSYQVT